VDTGSESAFTLMLFPTAPVPVGYRKGMLFFVI